MAEKKAKERIPTAKKRDLQSKRRNLANRSYKSEVNTAVRALESALSTKDASVKEKLNIVCSLMDKGVKKGVFKANKASRTKSSYTLKANTIA